MPDLDLDVLAGRTKTVKLKGEVLTVFAPDLKNLIGILKTAQDLQGLSSKTTPKIVMEALNALITSLDGCVPGLSRLSPNLDQLRALVKLIVELSTPTDIAELEKNGISLDGEGVKKNQD